MTLKNAYLDYLRLACWQDGDSLLLQAKMRRQAPKWRPSNWLQYKGWQSEQMFYGTGEQQGRRHWVWRWSGAGSGVLAEMAQEFETVYATRIDIQRTINMPELWDARLTYDEIKAGEKRTVSVIQSETGNTIYIGARTSPMFVRIYEKRLEQDDGNHFLRLEFEFKRELARAIYAQLRVGGRVNDAYDYYLAQLKVPSYILDWFGRDGRTIDASDRFAIVERETNLHNQMAWLSSLQETVFRLGADHESGPFVKRLLESWLERIDSYEW